MKQEIGFENLQQKTLKRKTILFKVFMHLSSN
jgi:hypothetical protein